ncbi:MFS transporter [Gluconacetobacter entanii]|uniref:MFS transporter n=1 Tax=Gluconacetobacter entanii TaxID=108528 RepID=UPI001C9343FC|nr:MFS transporter [Gluconacetobacter entanii]MBY4640944.1 MFS transporter [Gluconacetobacter entanii]MCW4579045.1 MFS transporter [Gluconacetobacter entanii]MCW4582445.1 MFS transporter [Gluconacetobacter entanii]MCW4585824.1 MFS transporter [Gluconacetobacter entanii]
MTNYKDRMRGLGVLAGISLCLCQLLLLLDFSVINISLFSIQKAFRCDSTTVSWVIVSYSLAFGSFMIFSGSLADTVGRKSLLIAGLTIFGIGSIVGGCASSIDLIVIGRSLQGIGAAACSPAILSLITTGYSDPRVRNIFIGIYSAASAAGFGIGMVVGGVLTQYIGWRAGFLYNVPAVTLAILSISLLVPNEIGGASLILSYLVRPFFLSVSTFILIYGIDGFHRKGIFGLTGYVCVTIGVVSAFFTIWSDFRKRGLFSNAVCTFEGAASNLASLVLPGLMGGIVLLLSIFFQEVWHLSSIRAGFMFLALGAAVCFTSPFAAVLLARLGWTAAMAVSCVGIAIGLFLVALSIQETKNGFTIILALIVLGIGFACFFVATTIGATRNVSEKYQGSASGILGTAQQLGTSLGVALLSTIAASGNGQSSFDGRGVASAAVVGALASTTMAFIILSASEINRRKYL